MVQVLESDFPEPCRVKSALPGGRRIKNWPDPSLPQEGLTLGTGKEWQLFFAWSGPGPGDACPCSSLGAQAPETLTFFFFFLQAAHNVCCECCRTSPRSIAGLSPCPARDRRMRSLLKAVQRALSSSPRVLRRAPLSLSCSRLRRCWT